MAHDPVRRRDARRLFVYEQRSVDGIATALGVGVATARRWKAKAAEEGDDWQIARAAHLIAGQGLDHVVANMTEELVRLGQSIVTEIKNQPDMAPDVKVKLVATLSDALAKGVAAAGRAAPKLSELAIAQDILKRLADFVGSQFPQHGEAFLEILEPFAASIAEAFGQ